MSEPLLDAIKTGDVDRLAELLAEGGDPNMHFKTRYGIGYGFTPLHVAVAELEALSESEPGGPIDAVVLLLRHGADVNGWDESRKVVPILTAAIVNRIEAMRILLAAGADPNVCGGEGASPLRVCAQNGRLEMARLLLHCGAGKIINEAGGTAGMNALGWAATRLDVEMIRLLLAHGADPRVPDADRMTVFDHLRHVSLPEDPEAQERLQQIRRLFDDMKPKDPSAQTAPDGKNGR
jgi:hypothetical protein